MIKKNINKKNIGIITLYHDNYNFGGLLQAYALPKAIEQYLKLGAEQIDYIPTFLTVNDQQRTKLKRNIFWFIYQMIYKIGVKIFQTISKKKLQIRMKSFMFFMQEIPHSKESYTLNSIQKSLSQYSTFICGGDQIWNPNLINRNIEVYTLKFVPNGVKKIAYAPSIAVLKIPSDIKQIMGEGIKDLDAVSIREKQSLPILQELVKRKVEVVVDPVLLLHAKDWDNEIKVTFKKKNYILCYLLGESIEQRKAVKCIARKLGISVHTFPHIYYNVVRKCDLFFGDIHDYTSGPREFLGLIKNAEFVITDSFHASVFSMIFEKPFVVFERNKAGEKGNMNSRIYDFLEEYHLESQLVTEKELTEMKEIPKVDYTYAHKHWEKRRKESLEFLENALQNK